MFTFPAVLLPGIVAGTAVGLLFLALVVVPDVVPEAGSTFTGALALGLRTRHAALSILVLFQARILGGSWIFFCTLPDARRDESPPAPLQGRNRSTLELPGIASAPHELVHLCSGTAVTGDRDRLMQVLGNLLGNALKFTPAGGTIVVAAAACEGGVQVSVSDSGAGIARDALPHVFDRFWQGDGGAHPGAGLGLAISKAIIEAHGGRIWVASSPGQGTTFCFFVPG